MQSISRSDKNSNWVKLKVPVGQTSPMTACAAWEMVQTLRFLVIK